MELPGGVLETDHLWSTMLDSFRAAVEFKLG